MRETQAVKLGLQRIAKDADAHSQIAIGPAMELRDEPSLVLPVCFSTNGARPTWAIFGIARKDNAATVARRARMLFGDRTHEFQTMLEMTRFVSASWPCADSFARLTAAEQAAAQGRGHIFDEIKLER